ANDLDTLDCANWGDKALLVAGTAIGARIARVLALTIHHDERVVTGQAADENVVLVRPASNHHALRVTQRISEIAEGALLNIFACDDRDAGRRVRNVLLETACSYHHCLKLRHARGILLRQKWRRHEEHKARS